MQDEGVGTVRWCNPVRAQYISAVRALVMTRNTPDQYPSIDIGRCATRFVMMQRLLIAAGPARMAPGQITVHNVNLMRIPDKKIPLKNVLFSFDASFYLKRAFFTTFLMFYE